MSSRMQSGRVSYVFCDGHDTYTQCPCPVKSPSDPVDSDGALEKSSEWWTLSTRKSDVSSRPIADDLRRRATRDKVNIDVCDVAMTRDAMRLCAVRLHMIVLGPRHLGNGNASLLFHLQ